MMACNGNFTWALFAIIEPHLESKCGFPPGKTKFLQVTGVDKRTAQRGLMYHIRLQIPTAMCS